MRRDDAAVWLLFVASLILAYGVMFAAYKLLPLSSPSVEFAQFPADYIPREQLKVLVDGNFPKGLSSDAIDRIRRSGESFPARYVDFKTADVDGDDRNEEVIAAYSDGIEATLRFFRKDRGGLISISPDSMPKFLGGFPSLKLQDLTGDSVPEIVLYLLEGGHIDTWVYRTEGEKLVSIGPSSGPDDSPATLVHKGVFLDVNRDGVLELVDERKLDRNNIPYYQVYKYDQELNLFIPFKILRNLADVS